VYSWERISPNLGRLLQRFRQKLETPAPTFSVIIPSYDRHQHLPAVLNTLRAQTFRDFEVIVVDQSATPWNGAESYADLDFLYVHTEVRGAVKARNTAAFFARGQVLAFTDDDCQPSPDWLLRADELLTSQPSLAGVEGLVTSAGIDDPAYRSVTNEGFVGIGFMTANLFLRRDIFHAIDGFDERFDNPHFREDTDLGWRALAYGDILFCREAVVFHPPHPRSLARESTAERARFFEKDALLLQKHPERYRELFLAEGHWERTAFWEHFQRGAEKYGVSIPESLLVYRPHDA
jgi:glycosyltransferase involved in cell wall biosynthesis